jgi:hypothetical protein
MLPHTACNASLLNLMQTADAKRPIDANVVQNTVQAENACTHLAPAPNGSASQRFKNFATPIITSFRAWNWGLKLS